MKKIFWIFLILLFCVNPLFAIEEVIPDFKSNEEKNFPEDAIKKGIEQEVILPDDVDTAFQIGIEKIFSPKKIDFKDNFFNNIEFGLNYKGILDTEIYNDGQFHNRYPFRIETFLQTTFGEEKNTLRLSLLPTRDLDNFDRKFWGVFSDVYYVRKFNENHNVLIGNSRIPIGYEGAQSYWTLPFVYRSQIATEFGNARATGIRFRGDFGYVDYDIGGYSSTRYMQHFTDGLEFTGWLNYKPFYKQEGSYLKNLQLGAGVDYGRHDRNYTVASFGAVWNYDKVFAQAEYAIAEGYNGSLGYNSAKAQGGNVALGYKITDRLEILGRFDIFSPDRNIPNEYVTQYTAGINYYAFAQRVRFAINYIFEQNKTEGMNKNMILFMTQFMI